MDSKHLPITGPCPIDLDAIGFDRAAKKAFCTHCSKNVVNLSNMTRPEARTFLQEHAGETMCVSYARNPDGSLKFEAPEPPLVPVSRLRPRPSIAATATAAAGLALALAACTPHGEDSARRIDDMEQPADGPRTIIPLQPRDSVPVPTAGMMMIPEPPPPPPPDVVEGKMEVPQDLVDGAMEIPRNLPGDEVQPCDKPEQPETLTPPPTPVRGRMRVPRHDL